MVAQLRSQAEADAQALDWLDRLLDAATCEREAILADLHQRSPAIHPRVVRMLAAASDAGASVEIAAHAQRLAGSAELAAPMAGDRVAGYRLLRELGRGGMAAVWLGEREDGTVRRQVAIKMPLHAVPSRRASERFVRERDVLAALAHPHIARLYDAGVDAEGRPFIVLEHVRGLALDAYCDHHRLDVPARLRLFSQVVSAVAEAHARLVIHRDLKPSNILVDERGDVKLLDFGIAGLLQPGAGDTLPQAQATADGAPVLTPGYAAPEQLAGGPLTVATDIYALGAVLYEILAGVPRHGSTPGGFATVVAATLAGDITPPSRCGLDDDAVANRGFERRRALRRALRGDIDAVVMKALALQPAERYRTADALAADLQALMAHRPVSARRPGLAHALRLALRRHRRAAAAGLAGVLAAASFGLLAAQQHHSAIASAERAEALRDFMFDLVDDAERSGREMLAAAVRRAHDDLADRPRLQGEVLGELARMQARLGVDEAEATLAAAMRQLQGTAPDADAALNRARLQQAELALSMRDLETARRGALKARTACNDTTAPCLKVQAYALNLESRLADRRGDTPAALDAMRQSVRYTAQGFGAAHGETAAAWLALSVIARNRGRLAEAADALAQAERIAAQVPLRVSDRRDLARTGALLDLDLGRPAQARDTLRSMLDGAHDAGEQAILWRLLSQAHEAVGDGPAALDAARRALALALAGPGENDPEACFVRQAEARAIALARAPLEGLAALGGVPGCLLQAGYAPTSLEVLRARRYLAELQLKAGAPAEARAALSALEAEHGGLPLALEASRVRAALAPLLDDTRAEHLRAQAVAALAPVVPADHPLLLQLRAAPAATTH